MNFKISIVSIIIASGLVGSVFAQEDSSYLVVEKEFTSEQIEEMEHKAVLITTHKSSFIIEFFPKDAPNHVFHFLKLTEQGYYDGMIFHRIIPGFMIQTGDPNTKNPEIDRSLWGTGGPGYQLKEEFNTIQHNQGIVSMARGDNIDSAGSQFFIVHQDSRFLDGKYTVFGRVLQTQGAEEAINLIAEIDTDYRDAPLNAIEATIKSAKIIEFTPSGIEADRNISTTKSVIKTGGETEIYTNSQHDVRFELPYRWAVNEAEDQSFLNLAIEPNTREHNVKIQIDESGFIPQILVGSEPRTNWELENDSVSTGFFSIKSGDEPKIIDNYIFKNNDGIEAHIVTTTQNIPTEPEETQFKIIQLHFNNSHTNYSIVYLNVVKWFPYELNAFRNIVEGFEIMIDGEMKPLKFAGNPIFRQVLNEAKKPPEPEELPPARIGGCLIATASYGSEIAPQVQLLREIRDNMVLQTQSGASFMNGFNHIYYSFSPTIADYERENPVFKEVVKLTLTPLLASLTLLQYTDIDSEHEMLGYGIGLILLNIGMYFVAPAILITKIRSFYKLQ